MRPEPGRSLHLSRMAPTDVLTLQRLAGNRAVANLMSDAPLRGTLPPVQRLLERGRRTGWGWWGWADDEAEQVWKNLDRKFNRELPALDAELAALQPPNPQAVAQIAPVRDNIAQTVHAHDGVIHRDKADALNDTLNKVIRAAEGVRDTVLESRREALWEKSPNRLTAMGQLGVTDPKLAKSRRGMLARLKPLQSNPQVEFDRSAWFKELRQLEADFKTARTQQDEARLEMKKVDAKRKLDQALGQAEQARRLVVLGKIKQKLADPASALDLCGGDFDMLERLVARMAPGEAAALEGCLSVAEPEDVLSLLSVHDSSFTDLLQLLSAWDGGEIISLRSVLTAARQRDNDADLINVLCETKDHERGLLEPVIAMVDVRTLSRLFQQEGTTATTLYELFVIQGVNIGATRELLVSALGSRTIELLSKVPDPQLINRLRHLESTADNVTALVHELPNTAGAVAAVKTLLDSNEGATLGQVRGLRLVQQARGLRTNAGSLILEQPVANLPDGARAAVVAGLAGIDSNVRPVLSHPNGAKFGDTFDNNQGRLPGVRGAGGYKEYYIEKDPASRDYHGQRRLVVNNRTGHVYYTADHYGVFTRVR